MCLKVVILVFLSLCGLSGYSQPKGLKPEGFQVSIGVAGIYSPLYEGDDELGLNLVPDLRARYGDIVYLSIPEGFGFRIRPSSWFEISPFIKYRFQRNESNGPSPFQVSGETTDLEGLGDVEGATETGGYVAFHVQPFSLRLEYRKGNGGHEGHIASGSLSLSSNISFLRYQLSANAEWATQEYFNAYYGVDAEQSSASGLATYEVEDAGLNSIGGRLFLLVPIFYPVTIATVIGYSRLQTRSADSTLVEERGSSDQFLSLLSVSWTL